MSSSYSLFSAEYTASTPSGRAPRKRPSAIWVGRLSQVAVEELEVELVEVEDRVQEGRDVHGVRRAGVALDGLQVEAKAGLNLALTPTGCGADGSATFALKASGSAGITSGLVSGSLVVKVAVVEVKPKGELNANFSYLYASGSVKATASIDLTYSLSLFGFEIGSGSLYKEKVYDKTWTWTKGLTAGARATLAAGH